VIIKYKRRRRVDDSSERPRVISKRQAISSVSHGDHEGGGYSFGAFRSIYGNNAMLRKAQAQMQADMDAISRSGNKHNRRS
jgi:hypothetical protein